MGPRRTWPLLGAAALGSALASLLVVHGARHAPAVHMALGRAAPAAGRSPRQTPLPVIPAVPAPAARTGMSEVTDTITTGGLARTYEVFRPAFPAASRIPALVVLHGTAASTALEEGRDALLPLADDGEAILVYPTGYRETWNAGSCCGAAQAAGIDDVAFVAAVVRRIAADPEVTRAYLAGYSNGGKMAYRVACADLGLVTTVIVVGAVPGADCPPGPPVSLLQLAGTRDERVAYDAASAPHVVNGYREATVTGQVASWRRRDGCSGVPVAATAGALRTQAWTCAGGTRVELATFAGGDHGWPGGGAGTPSAAQVIWVFVRAAP